MSTPPDRAHQRDANEPDPTAASGDAIEVSGIEPESYEELSVAGGTRSSTLTRRVIPLIALTMVVGMLALLAYALLKPDDDGQKIADGGYVVYERPEQARDFDLTTFDGETFRLSEQQGSIIVLNFWASWCGPCKEETPLLVNAADALGDDVKLIGVNAQDGESEARNFINEYRMNYAALMKGDGVAIDYGVTAFPETFVIDSQGRIVAFFPGALTSLEQLQQMVAEAR